MLEWMDERIRRKNARRYLLDPIPIDPAYSKSHGKSFHFSKKVTRADQVDPEGSRSFRQLQSASGINRIIQPTETSWENLVNDTCVSYCIKKFFLEHDHRLILSANVDFYRDNSSTTHFRIKIYEKLFKEAQSAIKNNDL
uniref:Uncharacterized protein n=1 Tax=Romanomermis culicivorax TaxID=13658 RepID=A0A915IED6_ROMCU